MATDAELRLVSKILMTGDLRTVLRSNISQSMFSNAQAREIFKFIKQHYHNPTHYGQVPTKRVALKRFPAKLPEKIKETLDQLCEEVREDSITRALIAAGEEMADLIDAKEPYEALALMRAKINSIQTMTTNSRDLILADGADELIQEYEELKTAGIITGIPWPWQKLNEETGGIQQQDFVIIFGRPKHMKSWIGTKVITHAYGAGARRVLVYSCEMPPKQFRKRVAACVAEINYERLKKGKLRPDEEFVYFSTLRRLKDEEEMALVSGHKPSIMFTSDKDDMMGGGVSHILAKAESFKPDLILVDSFYRMKNDRSGKRSMKWQDQAAIIQDLKHMTQQLDIPVIGITQRTRKKTDEESGEEDLEDIAYADAAGQEADLIMRVKKGATMTGGKVNIEVMIAGAREIKPGGMLLNILPCTSWDFSCWLADTGKRLGDNPEGGGAEPDEERVRQAMTGGKGKRKAKRADDEKVPNPPKDWVADQEAADEDFYGFAQGRDD